jgi:helix-turn-helix protein
VDTIATPDTILRWHRELVLGRRTHAGRPPTRPGLDADIRRLVVRMATENATWGYTRIQGALKNLGYHVGRSSIARMLKEHGIPSSGQRPMTWRTFVRAHWPAFLDLFATKVSTIRGSVRHCAASVMAVMALLSCRVYRVRSAERWDEPFRALRNARGDTTQFSYITRAVFVAATISIVCVE